LHVPIRVGLGHRPSECRDARSDRGGACTTRTFVGSCTMGFDELKRLWRNIRPSERPKFAESAPDMIRDVARRDRVGKTHDALLHAGHHGAYLRKEQRRVVANLQMLLGNMGMECGGVNPLRGRTTCRAPATWERSRTSIPGYQPVVNEAARKKFEQAWGVEKLPDKVGLMIPQMMEGLVDKKIRLFYIFGENLANTEPDIRKVEHELASAEFLLPGYFRERDHPVRGHRFPGRRLERERRHLHQQRAQGQPRQDGQPASGSGASRTGGYSSRSPSAWDATGSRTARRSFGTTRFRCSRLNLCGIKYRRIEGNGLQWPCPNEEHPGTCFLHRDGQFTCGLGNFIPVEWTPPAEEAVRGISVRAQHRPAPGPLSHEDPDGSLRRLERSPRRGNRRHFDRGRARK
jgi:formate dehydrogenase major subunit